MPVILSLIPLVFAFVAVACFVKLAARILRKTVISWKNALFFVLILFAITSAKLLLGMSFVAVFPPVLALLAGTAISLCAGAWFFARRATTAEGFKLGWLGGLKLTALSFALMLLIAIPGILVATFFLPAS
jgi:hypothetical protein